MIDLHIHSNASDGTDSPEELLEKIQNAGIKIFALTDHDTITGALKMNEIIPEGVKFIRGIEFSCRAKNSKCHILGFNYDLNNKYFQEALNTGEKLRHEKFFRRIEFLRDRFGIKFSPEEIETLLKIPGVGKPHIANMIVIKGFAENRTEAIKNYINKLKSSKDKIQAELAINAINLSGGISVWAHPLGGEGEPEMPENIFAETLNELMSYGLKGLECYYSKYNFTKAEHLAEVANKNGLYISCGSDYHGKNKSIPLGKLNAENIIVPEEKINILNILQGVK